MTSSSAAVPMLPVWEHGLLAALQINASQQDLLFLKITRSLPLFFSTVHQNAVGLWFF